MSITKDKLTMKNTSLPSTINLQENGRLFFLWVMQNFKKYILPEIILKEGEDPCIETKISGLTLYQQFIGQFLNYQSPFKDILIYHGVGSGKTNTAINVYNILYNYTPKWNIFLLIPASLHDDPWLKDLNRWLSKDNFDKRMANIIIIHYDSPYADRDFLEKVKHADASKISLFIIDEVHKFINNVYNNISSKKGKRAQIIYDYIQQEKKDNSNTRIILLSATPVINNPFEFVLIFNLLRPNIFPSSESLFEQLFISSTNFTCLNENTKNMFQRRILGLVSYYIGATPDKFATKTIHYIKIPMENYQEEIYTYFENIEEKKEKLRLKMFRGKIGDSISTYSAYTRQSCNFVFPNISDKINGELRPRPTITGLKDNEINTIIEGKNLTKQNTLIKTNKDVLEYIKQTKIFINTFILHLKNILKNDINYSIIDDVKNFRTNYNSSFTEFYNSTDQKSNLFNEMYKCSPKFIRIIFNIFKTKGTVMIYSNYVNMEGLQLLKVYMNFFGFIDLNDDQELNKTNLDIKTNLSKDGFRFCEFHGAIDKTVRKINKEIFNKSENKYGKFCKVIMISPAGAEGINLSNVRQVHILEPYWNEVRIEQVIGRALRFCQHQDLPLEERKVDIFRYKMVRLNNKPTADVKIEGIARKKNNLLLSFIDAVKEAAIDCELFKAHNMMGSKYTCFQFNEESLFEKPIGCAYQSKLENDQKIDNGLNAKDSSILHIRVRKIKGVLLINDHTYSSENYYWFNDNTGIIYDYELDYPIGQVFKNDDNNYNMLENDVYIIENLIDIPKFKLYD